ncbi:hypothetical protein B0H14DRAFT_3083067 [Mycena olivaceomarginata]|nr:hypothetical protein B0H14DRAFT_3083067 [Mycena olivaceomarginata]
MSHPHPCLVCGIATFFRCSRCRNTWYCSSGHSHGDCKNHHKECHPALAYRLNMIAMPLPAEPSIFPWRPFVFLADEERPKICTPERPSHALCPLPLLQRYFEAQPYNIVLPLGLNGEPLHFPLHIFYSATAFARGSPINRSIYHITSGAAPKPWYGNTIVLKFNGARRQGYTDAGSNDLPALSAYFLSLSDQ